MKRFINKLLEKLGFKRRGESEPEALCYNCKHTDKSFDDEPCCYCDKNSEWEAQK